MALRVHLLGTVSAWQDDREIPLGPARQRAVFTMLALHAGETVTRGDLIDGVWGDDAPASASGNLYTYVSHLRRALGRHLLVSGNGGYRLRAPETDIDVRRLVALHDQARTLRLAGDVAGQLAAIEAALALWQGQPLHHIPGPYAAAQRTHLTELHRSARERRTILLARTSTLIGRDDLLATLRAAATDLTTTGRGGTIWLEGEPGIGKSALLTEAFRDLHEGGGTRIGWATGDELSSRMPMSLLLDCLDGLTRRRLTGIPPIDRVIHELRTDRPTLLVLDDLHWADEETLRAWRALHRRTAGHPLLLVAASRPGPGDRPHVLTRRVLGQRGARLLAVGPLTTTDLTGLARRHAPGADIEAAVTAAAGNPHYLRHLVASDGLSPSLIAAVGAHLDRYPEDTRRVLRTIAFLGDGCTLAEVAAVTGHPVAELARALDAPVAGGVLIPGADPAFRHPVVRRVLHEGTPTALRIMLHRAVAETIATTGGDPARVARQLLAGPVPIDAWAARWLAANVRDLARAEPATAVALLRRATAGAAPDAATRSTLTRWLDRLAVPVTR